MKRFFLASLLSVACLNAGVIATYNGGQITDEDVAPMIAGVGVNSFSDLPKEYQTGLINEMVAKRLFAQEATKQKLDNDPIYKAQLKAAKENLLAQQYIIKQYENVKISDADIKKYYNEHLDEFKTPEAVKTKHILVKTEKEAQAIAKQLKGLKGDALVLKFSELAKQKSLDKGSAARGGDIPFMAKGQLVPEYFDAAKKLAKGTISAPVKSQFGYHIILTEDYKASRQGTLAEASAVIAQGLKAQESKKIVQEKTQEFLKKANVKIK